MPLQRITIEGLDEAVAEERRLREEAFLTDRTRIAGIEIYHVTPRLLARLLRMESCFFGYGEKTPYEAIRFLWALSTEFSTNAEIRDEFIKTAILKLAEFGEQNAIDEIGKFLDNTFLDSPSDNSPESKSYVSAPAWIVYRMAACPLKMTAQETLDTPLVQLYQYIKCDSMANGQDVYNSKSDPIIEQWSESRFQEWKKNKDLN